MSCDKVDGLTPSGGKVQIIKYGKNTSEFKLIVFIVSFVMISATAFFAFDKLNDVQWLSFMTGLPVFLGTLYAKLRTDLKKGA